MPKYNVILQLLLLTILLNGCGANGLLIRYFYGEMDDKLYDRIAAYATFSETQKEQIKQSVDEYTIWHRKIELPRYVAFINEITKQIADGNTTTEAVLANFEKARGFAKAAFKQSPFYDSAHFLKDLSEQQVNEIDTHFSEQDKEFQHWHEERQKYAGNETRLKSIVKNTKRITDINLNAEQQEIIKQSLEKIKESSLKRHETYNHWQAKFIEILHRRNKVNFADEIKMHIALYQNQIKIENPRHYNFNLQITADLVSKIIKSLDEKQKQALLSRFQKFRETLQKISAG